MADALLIVNPAACGGLGSDAWVEFHNRWAGSVPSHDVVVTNGPGHATEVAAEALGYSTVVAVGGDGTIREIVVGLMQQAEPRPRLAAIPTGTGNDTARSVGVSTVADAVAALQGDSTRAIDVIRIDCHDEGQPVTRYACLTTSVGVSSVVIGCLKPWMKRTMGAQRAYMLATLKAVLKYRAPEMVARWDGGEHRGDTLMVNVGNAERESGGSMRMSPGALMDDGLANINIISSAWKPRILRKLPLILTGDHIHEPEVQYFMTSSIEVESDPPAGLQMDGDAFGTTPAKFTVCPKALEIHVPPEGGV